MLPEYRTRYALEALENARGVAKEERERHGCEGHCRQCSFFELGALQAGVYSATLWLEPIERG